LRLQRFVNALQRNGLFFLDLKAIHSYDDCLAVIDRPFGIRYAALLDFLLDIPTLDGLQHAAKNFDLLQIGQSPFFDLVGRASCGQNQSSEP